MKLAIAICLLLSVGCTYTYGPKLTTPVVYKGMGWDSGLAYGDAVSTAEKGGMADADSPARVSMECSLYGVKPVVFGGLALGAVAIGSVVGVVAVGIASLALVFIPNCYATLIYETAAAGPVGRPMRRHEGPRAVHHDGEVLPETPQEDVP